MWSLKKPRRSRICLLNQCWKQELRRGSGPILPAQHVLTSQVNISSLWMSVAACFIWTAVNPVASLPPPHPLPGSPLIAGCPQLVRRDGSNRLLAFSWGFFWNACIAVDRLQRRKFAGLFCFCFLLLWERWRDLTGWNQSSYSSLSPRIVLPSAQSQSCIHIPPTLHLPLTSEADESDYAGCYFNTESGKSRLYDGCCIPHIHVFRMKRKMQPKFYNAGSTGVSFP